MAGPFTRSVENRRNPDPFQAGRRKAAGLPDFAPERTALAAR